MAPNTCSAPSRHICCCRSLGLGYWPSLIVAPIIVGMLGIVIERFFLQWLYKLDHLYGLLLTFGLALIIEGVCRHYFGTAGLPYALPDSLQGGHNLGFMFLPNYRAWVIVASLTVCLGTWFMIERTRIGAYLRAATENPTLVRAFGINVPRMITLDLRLRRRACRLRRRDGGADLQRVAQHGLGVDHRRVRRGRHRRHGLDSRRHRHRLWSRHHRRA